jgi:SAM-dependent methyltransferase
VPVLRRTDVRLDLLDVSPEMIEISKRTLEAYAERTTFICEDALEYLAKAGGYDIVFAAWTLHNFPQDDKKKLLTAIRENLANGGTFILLDKVYPMTGQQELLEHQNARYRKYLPSDVAQAIITHEIEDASDAFRMDQDTPLATFSKVGFASAEILDRIERDVILVAKK